MRKAFYRRQLPHLNAYDRPHFITSALQKFDPSRMCQTNCARRCVHDHHRTINLCVAIVMPDHVHMIFTPLVNQQAREIYSLASIMDAIKEAASHKVNRALGRKGSVWQAESFDHVLRSSESIDAKIAYILANPVRAGLVNNCEDYEWLWRRPNQTLNSLSTEIRTA